MKHLAIIIISVIIGILILTKPKEGYDWTTASMVDTPPVAQWKRWGKKAYIPFHMPEYSGEFVYSFNDKGAEQLREIKPRLYTYDAPLNRGINPINYYKSLIP